MKVTIVVEQSPPRGRRRVAAGRIGPGIATIVVVEDWYRGSIDAEGVEAPESRRAS